LAEVPRCSAARLRSPPYSPPSSPRGVTASPGIYFVGLPWLHTWGSGRFSGVARDAQFVVDAIRAARETVVADQTAAVSA